MTFENRFFSLLMPAVLGSQMPVRHLHSFTVMGVIIERRVASRRIVPNFSAALGKITWGHSCAGTVRCGFTAYDCQTSDFQVAPWRS